MASGDKIPQYFKIEKLVGDITECVASLLQEFTSMYAPIDDSSTVFHRFCAKLEQFLSLGLKEKNMFGKKRYYWDYMLRCLVSNRGGVHEGLKFVKNNTELKTSVGRGRAFLRFCLVHQCLADALQQCVMGGVELTPEWYASWAPIRDEGAFNLVIVSLYDLSSVQFDLSPPSCHDLDLSWPTFNRKELGSPFNWKAISRSASISSLTSSISAVDTYNNSVRSMAAMGSVQEGSEGGSIGSEVAVQQEDSGLEQGTPARTDGSSRDEGDEVWWMSEDAHSGMEAARGTSHSTNNSVTRERRHSGEEEEWRRNGSSLWKEWMREREEWREKEAGWRKEAEELRERYARLEEEKRIEVDMLRAKVLEMEVSTTMADWASVGVQATGEEGALKVDEEEKMDEIRRENEQLKIALEKMRVSCVDEEGGGRTFSKCEFCSKERRSASVGESNFQPRHDDDLKREYESQIRNVRELRGMYEERMKAAEEQSKKLREDLQEKSRRLELSRRRCSELRAHSQELETLLGEQEGVAKGLQTRLSASLEEGRALASQLATVNRLFGRLGDTAELDFERLRLLQNSVSEEGKDECDRRSVNESSSVCGNGGNAKQEGSELREIAASLPKVWRLLVELLGEEQKEEEASEGTADADGCFDSVPTPYGPRLVISVSRTFIRLKDLILEKKTLQNELGRIRDLNGRLESKLKQQERRLATVKVELKRTWGLVGRMRAQHKQLHTSEQVLRYELQQKRKLLGELKQELEYCREKWELARIKNSQSEKEWQLLRQEFTARRSGDAEPSTEVLDNVNSPESGFSDGRGEDEEDDDEDPQAVECVGENEMDGGDRAGNSKASEDKDNLHCEENQTLPIDLNLLGQELNIYTDNPSPSSVPPDPGEDTGGNSASVSNDETDTKETSTSPPSSRESSNAGTSSPETGSQQAGGASAERSMEERLQARAERLRRLEEQCDLLFRKVTRTTTRSAELSSRLEELHEQYGDQQPSSSGEDGGTEDGQVVADIETGEIQPEKESSVGLHPLRESYLTGEGRSDSESSSGSSGFPPLRESVLMRPPTPPPLPGSSSSSQFSPLEERVAVRPPTPPPLPGSSSSSQFSPLEERVAVRPPTPPPLPSSLPAIRLPSLVDHSSISDSALPSEAETPVSVSSNVNNETRSEVSRPNQQLLLDKSVESSNRESSSSDYHQLRVDSEDNRASVPNLANDSTTEEPPLTMETIQEESIPASSIPSSLFPQSDFEDMSEINENMESEDLAGEGSETSREEEEMLDEEDESIVGLSRDRSREGSMEDDEEREDEEVYLAEMSDTIYGLHHGPLFDDGMSPSDDDNDEEECAQGGIAEEEDIEDTDEEEGLNTTPGSIGVASLLLQQLPKRMDILRRERRSLEQRLEEGEAALGRAMASSAAAERRARVLERGLAQAHERVRVLEMEAAVERNERLLEIKSALDASSPSSGSGDSNEGRQSNRLQEEIDNLQRQTLAQIAEFQAAALVSKAQKEQLCNLNDEIERQEKVVKCLEEEVASLRKEREEQSTALKDSRVRLKEALVLAAKSQEEADNKQFQIDKLKAESELSSKENAGLQSRLTAAESEISRLNAEIVQLKEDSDRLREAVVRLTGDKEALFRSKHNLEEMRRLVLEDSRWVADKEMDECTACGVTFSLMVRRHHCRSCGKIFCGACSSHWLALNSASSASQPASLVAGVVESLMGVAGKRSRACADCFAAYSGENAECLEPSTSSINHSQVGASNEEQPCSSKSLQGEQPEGSGESGLSAAGAVIEDEDDEEEDEDFSMISEEEVVLSQCTPYVPNPRTLQYWKSCEIQSGVMSSASDLLAACAADGAGKGEEVWVRAGAIYSVPLLIEETRVNIHWEFSTNPNSIAFSVLYKTSADIPMSCALIVVPTTRVNSHLNPVRGRLRPKRAGVYILMFDNSFSRFTGKTISYCLRAEVPSRGASGRESVTNSSRSSVEPFPDLPVHPEETDEHGVVSGETDGEVKVTTEESHVDDQG